MTTPSTTVLILTMTVLTITAVYYGARGRLDVGDGPGALRQLGRYRRRGADAGHRTEDRPRGELQLIAGELQQDRKAKMLVFPLQFQ